MENNQGVLPASTEWEDSSAWPEKAEVVDDNDGDDPIPGPLHTFTSNATFEETKPYMARRWEVTKGYDPYAHISKNESKTETGALTGYGVEVQKENGEWSLAGTVGPGYLLIPNSEMREIAYEIAEKSPWDFEEDMVMFDGKKFTLTMDCTNLEVRREVKVGDMIGFGLMIRNSYDGLRAGEAMIFAKRLACTNGMVSRKHFAHYRFRHSLSNAGWQEDVKATLAMLQSAPAKLEAFVEGMKRLGATRVSKELIATLRHPKTGALRHLGDSQWARTIDRYARKEDDETALSLFNAATNVLWHHKNLSQSHIETNDKVVSEMLAL